MVIAIDYDHTIIDTHNPNLIDGRYPPPLPGALEALKEYYEGGHEIIIHSCNRKAWIREWLDRFEVSYHHIWTDKPVAEVYLDDKGRRFEGWDKAEDYLQ